MKEEIEQIAYRRRSRTSSVSNVYIRLNVIFIKIFKKFFFGDPFFSSDCYPPLKSKNFLFFEIFSKITLLGVIVCGKPVGDVIFA